MKGLITNKNTFTTLSAVGTTASFYAFLRGARAILIVGGSLLSAASTWYKQKRSQQLSQQDQSLDKQITLLEQEYPYVYEATKLSITAQESKKASTSTVQH